MTNQRVLVKVAKSVRSTWEFDAHLAAVNLGAADQFRDATKRTGAFPEFHSEIARAAQLVPSDAGGGLGGGGGADPELVLIDANPIPSKRSRST